MAASIDEARRMKSAVRDAVSPLAHIVGLGLTRVGEDFAVKVNLREAADPSRLPKAMNGVPVVYEVVGSIRKSG